MPMTRTLGALALLVALSAAGLVRQAPVDVIAVVAAQPAQPEQQTEFVPLDELPPQDQLPAAPLLVTAYIVVIVVLFAYVFSLMRRLAGVQQEMTRLEADLKRPRG